MPNYNLKKKKKLRHVNVAKIYNKEVCVRIRHSDEVPPIKQSIIVTL
jgi:hypothetical protein